MKNENYLNDEIIIYTPICSKCNCEIKDLDFILTFNCNCNNKDEELNMMEKDHGCICVGCRDVLIVVTVAILNIFVWLKK